MLVLDLILASSGSLMRECIYQLDISVTVFSRINKKWFCKSYKKNEHYFFYLFLTWFFEVDVLFYFRQL